MIQNVKYKLAYQMDEHAPQILTFSTENGRNTFVQLVEQTPGAHIIDLWRGPDREMNVLQENKYIHVTEKDTENILRCVICGDAVKDFAYVDDLTKETEFIKFVDAHQEYREMNTISVLNEMLWRCMAVYLIPLTGGYPLPLTKDSILKGICKFLEVERDIKGAFCNVHDVGEIIQYALFGEVIYG